MREREREREREEGGPKEAGRLRGGEECAVLHVQEPRVQHPERSTQNPESRTQYPRTQYPETTTCSQRNNFINGLYQDVRELRGEGNDISLYSTVAREMRIII